MRCFHVISRIPAVVPGRYGGSQEPVIMINMLRWVHVKGVVGIMRLVVVATGNHGCSVVVIQRELRHAGGSFDRRPVSLSQYHIYRRLF
ncbi:hypothetical protein HanIR_Chr05g0254611 [Helianthus annuus]|nr:hypothetical protein HanIR_Chr05g0254611 [Helianthus annuus]